MGLSPACRSAPGHAEGPLSAIGSRVPDGLRKAWALLQGGRAVKLIDVSPDELAVSPELVRSGSAKTFEERLRSSIDEVGLAEPLKVAANPEGGFLVIDGAMRLRAVRSIREKDASRFASVAAYLLDYGLRYEIRYQSDIY